METQRRNEVGDDRDRCEPAELSPAQANQQTCNRARLDDGKDESESLREPETIEILPGPLLGACSPLGRLGDRIQGDSVEERIGGLSADKTYHQPSGLPRPTHHLCEWYLSAKAHRHPRHRAVAWPAELPFPMSIPKVASTE